MGWKPLTLDGVEGRARGGADWPAMRAYPCRLSTHYDSRSSDFVRSAQNLLLAYGIAHKVCRPGLVGVRGMKRSLWGVVGSEEVLSGSCTTRIAPQSRVAVLRPIGELIRTRANSANTFLTAGGWLGGVGSGGDTQDLDQWLQLRARRSSVRRCVDDLCRQSPLMRRKNNHLTVRCPVLGAPPPPKVSRACPSSAAPCDAVTPPAAFSLSPLVRAQLHQHSLPPLVRRPVKRRPLTVS